MLGSTTVADCAVTVRGVTNSACVRDPEPKISYRDSDGGIVDRIDPSAVVTSRLRAANPWRTFRSHRGQPHYSGTYWSSTTGGHVVYESRLELARLILADFDPGVVSITAQPFLLEHEGRRHVPDFLLGHDSGLLTVVNVKPAERLDRPKVRKALAWAGRLFESQGWRSEIWSGIDPTVMANVRYLGGYRRSAVINQALVERVAATLQEGDTIGEVEDRLAPVDPSESRPAILHLLWRGTITADLSAPLDRNTEVVRAA
jgi:hypothetical protein